MPQKSFSSTFQPMQPGSSSAQAMQTPAAPAAPAPPPKPAGPPPTIALMTADVSKISGNLMPIVNSLRSLYQAGEQVAASQPPRKRELDDASKKLGGLVWKMNEGTVSESVTTKLLQLAASLDAYDYPGAAHVQVQLTTGDWDECSSWLTALKRLIKIRQMSH
jgi:protein transport protein SEC31